MASSIKTVSARFNVEVKPFQHVRIEVTATITKSDDKDEVRNELVAYAQDVAEDISLRIYNIQPRQPLPPDDIPI